MSYRYYSTQRPVAPGSFPKPEGNRVEQVVNFPAKTYVDTIWKQAWGYIDYEKALSYFDVLNYELVPVTTKKLHLCYIGEDSWGRYVYEDENGKLWKLTDCCSPREVCEERGDKPVSSYGDTLDGEPDCHMAPHVAVEYVRNREEV